MWVAHKHEVVLHLTLYFVISCALPSKSDNENIPVPCPRSCTCQFGQESWSISCHMQPRWNVEEFWMDVTEFVGRESLTHQVSIYGAVLDVSNTYQKFHYVHILKLEVSNLMILQSHSFYGLKSLVSLDLSNNSINHIEERAFDGLHDLKNLNLSHNKVQNLPVKVFQPVPLVKNIYLGNNMLEDIPQELFHVIPQVEVIDLSLNRLSYLTSVHFSKLQHVKYLNLAGNMFKMFHKDFMPVFHTIPTVDLSNNPFDCSCAVLALRNTIDQLSTSSNHSMMLNTTMKSVSRYSSDHFKNLDKYLCHTPHSIAREPLVALNTARLSCAAPIITNISKSQQILTTHDLYLMCVVFGYPSPAIKWNTPWGSSYMHRSYYPLLGDSAVLIKSSQSYEYEVFMDPSHITVFKNGSLHITKFRGYFAGYFTCVGIGPSGNDSSTVFVGITNHFSDVYYKSWLVAACTLGGVFICSCIFILLRMLIQTVKRKHSLEKDDDVSETESVTKTPDLSSCSECNNHDDHDDHDDNNSSQTYVPSPISTPESDRKTITPDENNPAGWLPVNIFETLDEARSRLSIGVGRKMEKVRSQVQSIRDSGTVYVHNFKNTSSLAANRVRAGMVLGVETIKYSAQSIREFCWVGDMSGQTISMISVSTNVDTEKQTEVIHTVTFV